MGDIKKEFRTDNKEKFKEHKAIMLEKVDQLIERGGPFMLIGDNGAEGVVAIGGSPKAMAEMLAKTMAKIDDVRHIIELACEALDYATDRAERGEPSMMDDITDSLGCEDCPKKDTCKIYKLAKKDDDQNFGHFVEELRRQHPEVAKMISKSKGEC